MLISMRKLVVALFLGWMVSLTACCSQAPDESTEAVVCCGGACDAPEGYCCADGTCHGNHAELPKWERDS